MRTTTNPRLFGKSMKLIGNHNGTNFAQFETRFGNLCVHVDERHDEWTGRIIGASPHMVVANTEQRYVTKALERQLQAIATAITKAATKAGG